MLDRDSGRRVIRKEEGIELIHRTVDRLPQIKARHQTLVLNLVDGCPIVEADGEEFFRFDVLQGMIFNFVKAVKEDDPDFFLYERGYKDGGIVDVEEFCKAKYYMGQRGAVRDIVLEALQEAFESGNYYLEVLFSGAIGWGKDYCSDLAEAYQIYLLSRLKNPTGEFDLAPGSSIIFTQQHTSAKLAKQVCFNQFAARIKASPYFKENFMHNKRVKSQLDFPNGITMMPVGSDATNVLGLNILGGRITELNFMKHTKDSIHTRFSGDREYDQAQELYKTLRRRMKSRFNDKGKCPGKLFLVSSSKYPGDFTDRKIQEAEKEKKVKGYTTILVRKYAIWEAKKSHTDEYFEVEKGNKYKRTRILKPGDIPVNPDDVIKVPIDWKEEFEADPDGACADLAGETTSVKGVFIPYKELIWKAAEKHKAICNGQQLFRHNSIVFQEIFGLTSAPDWGLVVNFDYLNEVLMDDQIEFCFHIDPSQNRDAAGIAISHIMGYQEKDVDATEDSDYLDDKIELPMYQVDGIMQIKAPPGDEVDFKRMEGLGVWLIKNLRVRWATADQYQSVEMLQAFRRTRNKAGEKVNSSTLSIDANPRPYYEVKDSIFEERIIYPEHPVFIEEVSNLQRDVQHEKIDHEEAGSKDTSDGVAGSTWALKNKVARTTRPHRMRDQDRMENPRRRTRVRRIRGPARKRNS